VLGCSDHPRQILGDDVSEGGSLAGAGHAEHDSLHDAYPVGPVPGTAMNVIAQNDRVLLPGPPSESLVTFPRDHHRRMWPLLFPAGSRRNNKDREAENCDESDGEI